MGVNIGVAINLKIVFVKDIAHLIDLIVAAATVNSSKQIILTIILRKVLDWLVIMAIVIIFMVTKASFFARLDLKQVFDVFKVKAVSFIKVTPITTQLVKLLNSSFIGLSELVSFESFTINVGARLVMLINFKEFAIINLFVVIVLFSSIIAIVNDVIIIKLRWDYLAIATSFNFIMIFAIFIIVFVDVIVMIIVVTKLLINLFNSDSNYSDSAHFLIVMVIIASIEYLIASMFTFMDAIVNNFVTCNFALINSISVMGFDFT